MARSVASLGNICHSLSAHISGQTRLLTREQMLATLPGCSAMLSACCGLLSHMHVTAYVLLSHP